MISYAYRFLLVLLFFVNCYGLEVDVDRLGIEDSFEILKNSLDLDALEIAIDQNHSEKAAIFEQYATQSPEQKALLRERLFSLAIEEANILPVIKYHGLPIRPEWPYFLTNIDEYKDYLSKSTKLLQNSDGDYLFYHCTTEKNFQSILEHGFDSHFGGFGGFDEAYDKSFQARDGGRSFAWSLISSYGCNPTEENGLLLELHLPKSFIENNFFISNGWREIIFSGIVPPHLIWVKRYLSEKYQTLRESEYGSEKMVPVTLNRYVPLDKEFVPLTSLTTDLFQK